MMKKYFVPILIALSLFAAACLIYTYPDVSLSPHTAPTTARMPHTETLAPPATASTPSARQATADTIPPDPPNGLVFSGSGPYQLYRQGDLTYRVNTGNGQTCILFATDVEWRKPRVYRHGCAAS